MSHAPVNTVPTQSAGSLHPPAHVTFVFDVADLDRTVGFYATLGFRTDHVERAGLPYETRVLVSDRNPGVVLFARQSFQRPVVGSVTGGVVQIGLRDPELGARLAALEGRVTWVLAPDNAAGPVTRASFFDPDGYIIELFA
jgi:catechol 2,3-dioxygenase-like lactoylglutathione lyase family enzyme